MEPALVSLTSFALGAPGTGPGPVPNELTTVTGDACTLSVPIFRSHTFAILVAMSFSCLFSYSSESPQDQHAKALVNRGSIRLF